jgi:hypothetical protein
VRETFQEGRQGSGLAGEKDDGGAGSEGSKRDLGSGRIWIVTVGRMQNRLKRYGGNLLYYAI